MSCGAHIPVLSQSKSCEKLPVNWLVKTEPKFFPWRLGNRLGTVGHFGSGLGHRLPVHVTGLAKKAGETGSLFLGSPHPGAREIPFFS